MRRSTLNSMFTMVISFTAALGSIAGFAIAQPSVAVLGAASGGAPWNADVVSKIQSTGSFSTVDLYDISLTTPTLAQLSSYQSVLVYSDSPGLNDRHALGNVLADYVDSGRGVVISTFSNANNDQILLIGGRFAADNYWSILPAPQGGSPNLTLGTVLEPGSPLMAGVNSFHGGTSSYLVGGALHPSAVNVANWSNGIPLVVRRQIGTARTAALNFYPPSNAVRPDLWLANTDGDLLMANALLYTAVPEPGAAMSLCVAGFLALRRRNSGTCHR